MGNDYARVARTIWGDDDFRDLPQDSQWLYFYLLTNPSMNYAGVADWRPARIAAHSRDMTALAVESASVELEQNLYIIVDRDTEEVCVRTYIRHDGLMGVWNMAAAMTKSHAGVVSKALRGVVIHELKRLKEDQPDLKGWGRPEVKALLRKGSLEPSKALGLLPRWDPIAPSIAPTKGASIAPSIAGHIGDPIGDAKGDASLLTPTPTPNSPTPNSVVSDSYLSTEGTKIDSSQRLRSVKR